MKKEKIVYVFFTLIFLSIIFYSYFSRFYYYILDSFLSIVIISILFFLYKYFKLNSFIFLMLCLALLSHNLGIFGFYDMHPLNIQYDHITHFLGGFSLILFFLNFLLSNFKPDKFSFIFLIIIAFLTSLGIGSIIEISEYFGYSLLGEGEGFFYFGGTGDIVFDKVSGDWVNSSLDMVFNLIGSLTGLIFYFAVHKFKLKLF